MSDRISLALVFHNHQPVGNFGWVIAETYERAYLPMVAALERHPCDPGRPSLHRAAPGVVPGRATGLPGAAPGPRRAGPGRAPRRRLLRAGPGLPARARPARPAASDGRRDRASRRATAERRLAGRAGLGARPADLDRRRRLPLDDPRRRPLPGGGHRRRRSSGGPTAPRTRVGLLTVFGSDKALRYGIPFGSVEDDDRASPGERHADGRAARLHGRRRREVRGVAGHVRALLGCGRLGRPVLRRPRGERPDDRHDHPVRLARPPARRSAGSTCRPRPTSRWASGRCPPTRASLRGCRPRRDGGRGALGPLAAGWLLAQLPGQVPGDQRPPQADAPGLGRRSTRCRPARRATSPSTTSTRASRTTATGTASSAGSTSLTCGWPPSSTSSPPRTWPTGPRRADRAGRSTGSGRSTPTSTGPMRSSRRHPARSLVIDPAEGGGVGGWDIRAARHALTSVLRRRPEAYHARLDRPRGSRGRDRRADRADRRRAGGARDDPRRGPAAANPGSPPVSSTTPTSGARASSTCTPAGTTADAFAGGSARARATPTTAATR